MEFQGHTARRYARTNLPAGHTYCVEWSERLHMDPSRYPSGCSLRHSHMHPANRTAVTQTAMIQKAMSQKEVNLMVRIPMADNLSAMNLMVRIQMGGNQMAMNQKVVTRMAVNRMAGMPRRLPLR